MYKLSPFLHIFARQLIKDRIACRICAEMYIFLAHIFFYRSEGLKGDVSPAQIQNHGETICCFPGRSGNGRGARGFSREPEARSCKP